MAFAGLCSTVALSSTGWGQYCSLPQNLQLKITPGTPYVTFCDGLDGAAALFLSATFRSVNSDLYAVRAYGHEDTKGVRTNSSWCSYTFGSYQDNFDHKPYAQFGGCSGRFINISMELAFDCITPGDGSDCQIAVDDAYFGGYYNH